ncbi:MAG: hypothetical protein RL414_1217 [Actinomycetota bacterium]|jgi:anti-sigma factor (TIGR02949 family)
MSCGNPHETPCHDVLHALIAYVDHEVENPQEVQLLEIHIQECPPCAQELEHEQKVLQQLKARMSDCFCEEAPDALHERIALQTAELAQQMQSQFFGMGGMPGVTSFQTQVTTQYSRTEFTVDGIETRIEIETTEITHTFEENE